MAAVMLLPAASGSEPGSAEREQPVIVGVSTHFDQGKGDPAKLLAMLRDAGVSSIRDEVYWNQVETVKGQLVMPFKVQEYVDIALANRLQPLLILDYGNPFYDSGSYPISEEAQQAFVRYCEFVARSFKGKVRLYEIWNEWDCGTGIHLSAGGSAEDYVHLLRRVYPRLKAIDKDITVLAGALSSRGIDSGWIDQFGKQGAFAFMDGLSIHPYTWGARDPSPDHVLAWIKQIAAQARRANSDKLVPLFVTEIGWPTPQAKHCATLQDEDSFLTRLYLGAREIPELRAIWWYTLLDDQGDASDPEANFGLLRPDMTPKPAYFALRAVVGELRRPANLEKQPTP